MLLCSAMVSQTPPTKPWADWAPFLGTWRRVYAGILIYLVVIIFLFYLFTRAYR